MAGRNNPRRKPKTTKPKTTTFKISAKQMRALKGRLSPAEWDELQKIRKDPKLGQAVGDWLETWQKEPANANKKPKGVSKGLWSKLGRVAGFFSKFTGVGTFLSALFNPTEAADGTLSDEEWEANVAAWENSQLPEGGPGTFTPSGLPAAPKPKPDTYPKDIHDPDVPTPPSVFTPDPRIDTKPGTLPINPYNVPRDVHDLSLIHI